MRLSLLAVIVVALPLTTVRADDPPAAEPLLQGVWRVTDAVDGDAKDPFAGELRDAVFVFSKGELTIVTRINAIHKGAFTAERGKDDAGTLDFVWGGKKVQGLITLQKDRVVLCFDKGGKERPASLQVDSERPTMALARLEKLAAGKDVLLEKETKWTHQFADDFLAAFVAGEPKTYQGMLNEDVFGKDRNIYTFDYLKDPGTGEYRLSASGIAIEKNGNSADVEVDVQFSPYRFKAYSMDVSAISPTGEEVVCRGTLSGKKDAKYTMRLRKEKESGRWAVAAFDWQFVK
jgi:hypothetical protein